MFIPIRERVRALREQFCAPPAAGISDDKHAASVAIQNGTLRTGLAASTKAYLEGRGVIVLGIGDAPQRHVRSVIMDYKGPPDRARLLAAELCLPLTSIVVAPDPASDLDALVVLGEDFQPR